MEYYIICGMVTVALILVTANLCGLVDPPEGRKMCAGVLAAHNAAAWEGEDEEESWGWKSPIPPPPQTDFEPPELDDVLEGGRLDRP